MKNILEILCFCNQIQRLGNAKKHTSRWGCLSQARIVSVYQQRPASGQDHPCIGKSIEALSFGVMVLPIQGFALV